MKYKDYERNSYNIHTIKTDKFKNNCIEVVFRSKADKKTITKRNFLCDILTNSTKTYKTTKELNIQFQELYNDSIRSRINRVGETLLTNFYLFFLDSKYTEETMTEESIRLLFDVINNPNIQNGSFDENSFNVVKNKIKADIISEKENPLQYSLKRMLSTYDDNAAFAIDTNGYLKDLEKITPQNLVETYQDFIENDICDIFVIGNFDMDNVVKLIDKYYKDSKNIKKETSMYSVSTPSSKLITKKEKGDYTQANLVVGCSAENLTKKEKNIVMQVYNIILGGGSLETKLYKYLREENSLCYSTFSEYQKYDKMLILTAGIDKENFDQAVKLMKKSLKEMSDGKISKDEIENAKKLLVFSLTYAYNKPMILLNYYISKVFDGIGTIEEIINEINSVTLEEIVEAAKKIKIRTIYFLTGDVA